LDTKARRGKDAGDNSREITERAAAFGQKTLDLVLI
jgi:hypothetical protein